MVEYFMRRKAKEMGLHFMPGLAAGAIEKLTEYDWPGNVRELSNAVERAIIIHEGKPLSFEDIVGIQAHENEQNIPVFEDNHLTLNNFDTQHIRRAMKLAGGKIEGASGAAATLGMNPGTLRSRMRKLGIPFGKAVKGNYGNS